MTLMLASLFETWRKGIMTIQFPFSLSVIVTDNN